MRLRAVLALCYVPEWDGAGVLVAQKITLSFNKGFFAVIRALYFAFCLCAGCGLYVTCDKSFYLCGQDRVSEK